jgi:hypothetical protein
MSHMRASFTEVGGRMIKTSAAVSIVRRSVFNAQAHVPGVS